MYREIKNEENLVSREEETLALWKTHDVHRRCLEMNPDGPIYTVYDGPPTANGKPHIGHILTRAIKDIMPRYRRMRGDQVKFIAGWDTHGLPVELEVEKQLGLDGKEQIEAYGVEPFVKKCKESVFTYRRAWEEISERMAYSADMDQPYATYENSYIESEWWALKQLWNEDKLYKGYKIVPYCPRCGTALSSHELAQNYKDVREKSVFVRFKLRDEANCYFVAWTTTPWTLPSNTGLCVHPTESYVRIEDEGDQYILAEALVEAVFSKPYEAIERYRGEELVGKRYLPLFDYGDAELAKQSGEAYRVVSDDYVSMSDGSGIVHIAPAFGEDDAQIAKRYELPLLQLVDSRGCMTANCGALAGKFCKRADPEIIEILKREGKLLYAKEYEHSYPFCWRCDTPLIYYARNSWFIKMEAEREKLIENNNRVHWQPDNVRTGRFGKFLENVVDWALSRQRYWGTPLPVWTCECGHQHCVGSIEELQAMSPDCPEEIELHKPYVDQVHLTCPECQGLMTRELDVIDCWFDSGSMPFAQYHYPFENKENFESHFPADFISEAQDQTRGWFYSLTAISTQLFAQSPFKNVICLGLVLDKDGNKMSKHIGNVVEPWAVMNQKGADATRWYFYTNSNPWLPSRFSEDAVEEGRRKYLATLRNTLSFFTLYANIDAFEHQKYLDRFNPTHVLDRWILSRLMQTLVKLENQLDAYQITPAGRGLQEFSDELSNWYVRRSRERFWASGMEDDKIQAYLTLYTCLSYMARMTAPFTPFIAEEIYQALESDSTEFRSVHEASWPEIREQWIDSSLETAMGFARDIVFLGRSARNSSGVKNRQALSRIFVAGLSDEARSRFSEELGQIVLDELNVKQLEWSDSLDDLLDYKFKPELRSLGKKLGRHLNDLRQALETIDGRSAYRELSEEGHLFFDLGGESYKIMAEELLVETQQREGFAVAQDQGLTVALDLELTEALIEEGLIRELVSKIQNLRKSSGFEVTDRIRLEIAADEKLGRLFERERSVLADELLADSIEVLAASEMAKLPESRELNGSPIAVRIERIVSGE
ncbi:MAG: isoleucine--tRNA ligase [Eubacteriales bacterium]|nr:isoleucine--tRNA ligase [Eubacteriales bacterium]